MRRSRLILVLGVIIVVGAAITFALVRNNRPVVVMAPTAAPLATATTRAAQTPVPTRPRQAYTAVAGDTLSPVIVERSPERGEALAPDGLVRLRFDRPMNRSTVDQALSVAGVQGSTTWDDARTVSFKPSQPWTRDAVYDVVLQQGAKAEDGAALSSPYQFRFNTTGFLEVAQVIPAQGTTDVAAASAITVVFNRPVVALTSVAQTANQPQPLSIADQSGATVAGTGEWLNTSVYVFHPTDALRGGARYSATIAAGLIDTDGSPLREAYRWDFAIAAPQVIQTVPDKDATLVGVEDALAVTFNQPAPGNADALRLTNGSTTIAGTASALGDTLLFTPTQRLQFDTQYTVEVGAAAGLAEPFRWNFRTVPLPRVVGTTPGNGEQNADVQQPFTISFNAPIDPATVMSNLTWTPALTPTSVYTYYNDYDHQFVISFNPEPSSPYRVRIGPNIADPYGNTTGQTLDVGFRTGQLPPSVQMVVPGQVGTYDANRPTQVVLRSVNKPSVTLSLYRVTIPNVLQPNWYDQQPPASSRIRTWTVALNGALNAETLTRVDLAEGGGALPPGAYLLSLDSVEDTWMRYHTLVVSELNLTLKSGDRDALLWATRLSDGTPAANVPITFYTGENSELGQATTDKDGIARITFNPPGTTSRYAFAEQPFAGVGDGMSNGINPSDFGVNQSYGQLSDVMTIYTDRPIYRPGQVVHFKGAVRNDRDVQYSLPSANINYTIITRSSDGQEIARQTIPVSANGTFWGDVTLPANAALGQYTIGDDQHMFAFTVAAYRAPEFEVNVVPSQEVAVRGNNLQAQTQVRYFFGGPVANVPVEWHVLAEPYQFQPDGFERYTFGDNDDPWTCFYCWWRPLPPPTPIMTGTARTDASGNVRIPIGSDLRWNDGQPITRSVRLQIEATATGNDNSVISGRTETIVHQAGVYTGLATASSVAVAERPVKIDLVAVTTNNVRQPNQAVSVAVERREWTNRFIADTNGGGEWQTEEKRIPVTTQNVKTDGRGEAVFEWTPDRGGSYQVIARTSDGTRTSVSSTFVWVTGGDITWRQTNDDQLTLISDRTRYAPGDTASILIPSPYDSPTWALVTVERGGILSHEVIQLTSSSTVYQLPITAAHAPNIYVGVVLLAGPSGERSTADQKVGVLPLQVDPVPQTLKVTLQRDGDTIVPPGSTVRYAITTTDSAGVPVAAELSLDLVDKAVLSLMPRDADVLRTAFYGERGLGITTMSGLSASADRLLQTLLEQLEAQQQQQGVGSATSAAGGMAGDAMAMPVAAAPAAMEQESAVANRAAAPAGVELRENFADTAFWKADVVTDAAGRATVEIKLPDNLTTWELRGAAITADTRVGEGSAEVMATKPLLIRPVAPRFLVVGDEVELAANVSNMTDQPLRAQVALATSGISVTTPLTLTVDVPARGEQKVTWNATVPDVTEADLVFSAVSGRYSDAAKPRLGTGPDGTLPVYRYAVPETTGTGGELTTSGARTEIVALPPSLDGRQGEVTVRLDPSLASGLRDGLQDLADDLDSNNEAVVSGFLPNVLAVRAMQQVGISNPTLEQQLPDLVRRGIERLAQRQHADGGWGWWDEDESNPHTSAYVMLGLAQAKAAGFTVDANILTRGGDYLRGQRTTIDTTTTTPEANEQVFIAYALAQNEQDVGDLDSLVSFREKLAIYAKSLLAITLDMEQAGDARIAPILSDLNSAAIMSATGAHWEEDTNDWWSMNTDTRTTAIALLALARLDADNQLNPNVVRWLMVARTDGVWETSQETAWSLMALTAWLEHTGELKGNYQYAVALNGQERINGQVTPNNVDQPVIERIPIAELLQNAGNRLQVGRGDGTGVLYYTAHLRAFLPAGEVQALDRGFTIQRRYTLASCTDGPRCPAITEAKVGDVIRVDLTIISSNDRYYVRVEDPLPAGAEAVDTGLATTSVLAQGPQLERQSETETDTPLPWMGWWHWYSHSELRDEKVVLTAPFLNQGTYEYSYTMRATQPGRFQVIPTTANETYFPEVYGRGDGQVLTIR